MTNQTSPTEPADHAVTLPIARIRADGGTQACTGLHEATVQDYTEALRAGVTFPPIVVYHDGSQMWLADGFHRLAAFRQAGRQEIAAIVVPGTRRDAILHAVGANAQHGLRRTDADKRRAVETLLRDEEWGTWSDQEVARRCHVSPTFVSKMRATVHVDSSPERRYRRDGKEQTMQTANNCSGSPGACRAATGAAAGAAAAKADLSTPD